jgi:radical SAM superfamily enzyme YgiQ (UPF0313 family)
MGRQPFGLASPAAWLIEAGVEVTCVDLAKQKLAADAVRDAEVVGFFLPMHTATRLALPVIDRVRAINPFARLVAYGLYAPLNEALLREHGVLHVLGGEFEQDLVEAALKGCATRDERDLVEAALKGCATRDERDLIEAALKGCATREATAPPVSFQDLASPNRELAQPGLLRAASTLPRLQFRVPARDGLLPLTRYATLQVLDERRTVGYTEASRGCKHRCRHCPIVPVYDGRFRVVPADVVLADVRGQVLAGARHVTFGDPDFFNGIRHADAVVRGFAREFPDVTYDVTIKVEHLLRHAEMLGVLAETGCAFVTTAVESVDDRVLAKLEKGHTRADFERVVGLCRDAGLSLAPTFMPFTPWTTLQGYLDLLHVIERLDLVEHVSPIQLVIRLLIPQGSRMLELDDVRRVTAGFDARSLTYPWTHADPAVDELQAELTELVGLKLSSPRRDVFAKAWDLAHERAGVRAMRRQAPLVSRAAIPYLNEPWYC